MTNPMRIILMAVALWGIIIIAAVAANHARAADKPIGWVVKPNPHAKPVKPDCKNLDVYLNTPSCGKMRRE